MQFVQRNPSGGQAVPQQRHPWSMDVNNTIFMHVFMTDCCKTVAPRLSARARASPLHSRERRLLLDQANLGDRAQTTIVYPLLTCNGATIADTWEQVCQGVGLARGDGLPCCGRGQVLPGRPLVFIQRGLAAQLFLPVWRGACLDRRPRNILPLVTASQPCAHCAACRSRMCTWSATAAPARPRDSVL